MFKMIDVEVGKRYKITYQAPGQRRPHYIIADLIGEDATGYNFSGRPVFGTTHLSFDWLIDMEEVSKKTDCWAERIM